MTAFSDEEEVEFGAAENAPRLLAERVRNNSERGGSRPVFGEERLVGHAPGHRAVGDGEGDAAERPREFRAPRVGRSPWRTELRL